MDRLREAEPGQSDMIEAQIVAEWAKSGSATVDLLYQRGIEALESGEFVQAAEHLTAAIENAPDFAEAYNARASAYYLSGRIGPALDDLRQALVLNPQHFNAMLAFAVILGELDRPEDALEVFRQVHAINPGDTEVADMVERLELELGGRTL